MKHIPAALFTALLFTVWLVVLGTTVCAPSLEFTNPSDVRLVALYFATMTCVFWLCLWDEARSRSRA